MNLNNNRRIRFLMILMAVFALAVGAVAAQEGDGDGDGSFFPDNPPQQQFGERGRGGFMDNMRNRERVPGELIETLREVTGLQPAEIMQQLRDGQTLADLITANGGTVDAVISDASARFNESLTEAVDNGRIDQARADELLAQFEETVTNIINGDVELGQIRGGERRGPFSDREVGGFILDVTGLDAETVRQGLSEGQSLADIIAANGQDVETVKAEAIAQATQRINEAVANGDITQERADQMLGNLDTMIDRVLNAAPGQNRMGNRMGNADRGLMNAVLEATGLTQQELREQWQAGNSLADILAANGVDVDSFVEAQMGSLRDNMMDRLNATPESGE